MPTTRLSAETWPETAGVFGRRVQDAWQDHAPIDDFVELVRDLALLEQKHGLTSTEFYERYQRGEMGDDMELMRWATKVEIYKEMKVDLDDTFALLERYDSSGGVRGKYVERFAQGSTMVVLSPDVAEVFPDSDAVNNALRLLADIAARSASKTPAG